MKNSTRELLTQILLAVFLMGAAVLIVRWSDGKRSAAASAAAESIAQMPTDTVQQTIPLPTTPPTEATEPPVLVWTPAPVEDEDPNMAALEGTDLNALREVNEDVLGWITIPDTKLNYPLTQGEDNSHYLDHNWDGAANVHGSIFLECQNSEDLTDFNTIIYGHNMLDGSMFASLHKFAAQDHWKAHPYVYIVTDEGVLRYEIFSAYYAGVQTITYGLSFNQEETREEFIRMALENSQIDTGITPATTDRIITMSTCTGWSYDYRWVVHARLKMVQTVER